MSIIDYDQLDRQALLQIQKDIPIELKKRDKTMKLELRKRVHKLVEDAGYSVDEIMSTNKVKTPTKKAAPKYRNPDDSSATWTGRGRKPLWVLAATESGKSLDDLLI